MGRKLLLFIDDINMPKVDTYGTQQPVTLLKLFIERQGLYDRDEFVWKNVVDTHCLAACGPPGGARNAMDPRFVSLFNIFHIPFPTDESLNRIFSTILNRHFEPFPGDGFKALGVAFSELTLKVYRQLVKHLPPTPTRFHYVFNLRDLSRVSEGICTCTVDNFPEVLGVIRLWRNEVMRIFHDRLISVEDKTWFIQQVTTLLKAAFPNQADEALRGETVFGDFRNVVRMKEAENEGSAVMGEGEVRLNEDLGSYQSIKGIFEGILQSYNEATAVDGVTRLFKPMDLVLFDDALEHLCRIHRVLRLPRGNALLVGVGGSGKQSLTRLAAYSAGCAVFQITLTRTYGETEFREDLKSMYSMLNKTPVVFLFTDQHVADEGFLELVNNILTMGMVPALYGEDEKESAISGIRKERREQGLPDGKDLCWSQYVDRCRERLHVVLAMSPVGDALQRRCRNFPGMVNNTVIDWFSAWPPEALKSVADKFLSSEDLPAEHRENLTLHMMTVHQSVLDASKEFEVKLRRYNYVTPKNYLNFITTFKKQLGEKRRENGDLVQRLDGGLTKLVQAASDVAEMKTELAKQTVVVEQKTRDCAALLAEIEASTTEATAKQEAATEQEESLGVQSVEIAAQKEIAESKLAAALPALEQAAEALNDLSKSDIDEMKGFAKPHVLVQVTTLSPSLDSSLFKSRFLFWRNFECQHCQISLKIQRLSDRESCKAECPRSF